MDDATAQQLASAVAQVYEILQQHHCTSPMTQPEYRWLPTVPGMMADHTIQLL